MKKSLFKDRNNAGLVISFIVAWTILLLFLSKGQFGNNMIYALGQKRSFDSELFHNNVYMGEGVISPRSIVDAVFRVFMLINGGNWAGAALVWMYFGAFIQSLGIALISKKINDKYQIACSAILTALIAYCGNNLAGFSLIELATTGMGVALAFSVLSVSFIIGDSRNYPLAWAFAVCAMICHIHEGIYCCAVIFIAAAADCFDLGCKSRG